VLFVLGVRWNVRVKTWQVNTEGKFMCLLCPRYSSVLWFDPSVRRLGPRQAGKQAGSKL